MTYLLAKYTLLFLLTALLGFLFGYWFARRNLVDVSESFEDLRKANDRSDAAQWDRLFKHLESAPKPRETDLSDVYSRLDEVSNAVATLPMPEPVSLASVNSRLDKLRTDLRSIPIPIRSGEPDLQPLIERLDRLESGINAMPIAKDPEPVDLTPVNGKLDRIESAIRNIPKPVPAKDVNLQPVSSKLGALEQTVQAMSRPKSINLAPIDDRLRAIEAELGRVGQQLAKPTRDRKARASVQRESPEAARKQPRILSAALYGKKDDLKQISGIGPKLEQLLNQNGVYYFWQVAEWQREDIDVIDERLDAFKGRIARDNWVRQAKHLKAQPDAARTPAE